MIDYCCVAGSLEIVDHLHKNYQLTWLENGFFMSAIFNHFELTKYIVDNYKRCRKRKGKNSLNEKGQFILDINIIKKAIEYAILYQRLDHHKYLTNILDRSSTIKLSIDIFYFNSFLT
ncbi:hypothetical protein DFA_04925 [Cavenderia fasciculata]|uniref:Uncharacterized protein n=1 Tax=Cavenderia fasciculata TaxID=261658 RepID=F4PME5_CACFS|nr:uncharacterized protein DFA_04925 [Cavenderia fasciculata]EGG22795.1 hypothetical protein DFA_04925 [Cavenderia fasciculata]|eukprot:XP_004360646.1 hypothetical protein DFA_04925 [Cavenderia fasciculata]